ncbi:unnamed protein product, partial [Dovyalis caffra]
MAAIKVVSSHVLVVISSVVVLLSSHVSLSDGHKPKGLKICGFDAIYNFGDSLTDTGNAVHIDRTVWQSQPPNGKTIKKVTGRSCDGLLLIDYIAKSSGFPSIKTYLNSNEKDSHHGVNFAVAGATALPPKVLLPKLNISAGYIINSLNEQLQWFEEYLKGFCQTCCKEKLKSSLFIIGIGVNDYSQALFPAKKTVEEVIKMGLVSEVVETIQKAIEKVISYGATRVLVPGSYPFGCAPGFLGSFRMLNYTKDEHGFETMTEVCCGGPGAIRCGQPGSSSCAEPKKHVFWDGVLIVVSSVVVLLLSRVSSFEGNEPKGLKICGFDAIYNFGDSLTDTGNAVHIDRTVWQSQPPNGKTMKKVTGRSCDGLLLIDYIAKSSGFPSIKTYLNSKEKDSHHGLNFAVAGATALPPKVLLPKLNISAGYINNSLNEQLQWFDEYLKGFCQTCCKEKLKSSLFIIGIGVNDYSQALFPAKKTVEEVIKMGLVSEVVETIQKAIEKVISYGATRVLVPGSYPFGCAPGFLGSFRMLNYTKDEHGCLKNFNDFFKYHNDHLQVGLESLRKKYPGVSIIYGDYYNAMQSILDNLQKFGFETMTEVCCGGPGAIRCGQPGSSSCAEPKKHVFWDGVHPTQNTNKNVAKRLIQEISS